MNVSLLAAVDRNLVIGNERGMPWHLPADLKRFRRLTLSKPIIMGRTTYEHIGRPLDKRTNIVLTRRGDYRPEGVLVVGSMTEALQAAGAVPEVFVVGGGEVYRAALPEVNKLHLTAVDGVFEGTTYFPAQIPTPAGFTWREVDREAVAADATNAYRHGYVVLERIASPEVKATVLDVATICRTLIDQIQSSSKS